MENLSLVLEILGLLISLVSIIISLFELFKKNDDDKVFDNSQSINIYTYIINPSFSSQEIIRSNDENYIQVANSKFKFRILQHSFMLTTILIFISTGIKNYTNFQPLISPQGLSNVSSFLLFIIIESIKIVALIPIFTSLIFIVRGWNKKVPLFKNLWDMRYYTLFILSQILFLLLLNSLDIDVVSAALISQPEPGSSLYSLFPILFNNIFTLLLTISLVSITVWFETTTKNIFLGHQNKAILSVRLNMFITNAFTYVYPSLIIIIFLLIN
ncbi:hypothetical protein [Erysipelothrix anatis]|uniref:hypothetical protein n=1 Tax=Erysipelothrix anatis TaxID=2683713 RepID=UPI00135C42B4|nr:hypothetical protein [Erysipelothrix anatis]